MRSTCFRQEDAHAMEATPYVSLLREFEAAVQQAKARYNFL